MSTGPWGNSGGSGNGPQKPQGPKAPPPPDFDMLMENLKRSFGRFGGGGSQRPSGSFWHLRNLLIVGLLLWLATGIYKVNTGEEAIVLRFGAWVATKGEGLNYHMPWPIESVETRRVSEINEIEVGHSSRGDVDPNARIDLKKYSSFSSNSAGGGDRIGTLLKSSAMLTGDQNIVLAPFSVFWRISNLKDYLINARRADQTIEIAAESVMREVVGQSEFLKVLTGGRGEVEQEVFTRLQTLLDEYGVGVEIVKVQLLEVFPPLEVEDAYIEVQRAGQEKESLVYQAESYANKILPRARGQAEQIIQDANAYQAQVVQQAQGEAERFLKVYQEYRQAKEVTAKRLYLETMEEILAKSPKIIVDNKSGVVPYLPLPEVRKAKPQPTTPNKGAAQ